MPPSRSRLLLAFALLASPALAHQTRASAHAETQQLLRRLVAANAELCAAQLEARTEPAALGLTVGGLFIILATSLVGTAVPLLSRAIQLRNAKGKRDTPAQHETDADGWLARIFFALRHFGTGIILATAFIHLLWEAFSTFQNPCLPELAFEPTSPAIAMGALWLMFLLDFFMLRSLRRKAAGGHCDAPARTGCCAPPELSALGGARLEESETPTQAADAAVAARRRTQTEAEEAEERPSPPPSRASSVQENKQLLMAQAVVQKMEVVALESGIIFHSVIIGVTLGATSSESFVTLLIAMAFHQLFEGLALGGRIALLPSLSTSALAKTCMALSYALTTPIGIAIGIGARASFDENDGRTALAIGVLNSMSAGILLYTSLVELLAGDFIFGPLRDASTKQCVLAVFWLSAGAAAMSLIGKWA